MTSAKHRKSTKKPDLRKWAQESLSLLSAALRCAIELLKLIELIHSLVY
jgi:hypothetical protein